MNSDNEHNVNMIYEEETESNSIIINSQMTQGKANDITEELKPIRELIDSLEYDQARIQLEAKFQHDPNCIEVIDLLSDVYFSQDNIEGAIKMIKKSISLDPENNAEKYMTLAQIIQNPKLSLQCYQKGIEIYIKQLSTNSIDQNEQMPIKDLIASGYSSIAELYMTTVLCDELDAETICENSIKTGLGFNPNSFDVLLQLSNLRILRKRDTEAKEAMDKLLAQIKAIDTNDTDFPDHDFILNLSKNYAELSFYLEAIFLLDILVKLDDEDLECWYLLAFYHYQIKNCQFAMKCLKNFQKAHKKVMMQGKNNEIKEFEEAAKELYNTLQGMKQELTNQIEDDNEDNDNEGNYDDEDMDDDN